MSTAPLPGLGSSVTSHFEPGIVAASYFASLTGCLLTIELLHRRGTALGNLRSWLETLACATSMGLVGIWCMHFIGNRAIVLGNGDAQIQLVYNPGYTTLSVFLPIIGLTIAFSAAELPARSKIVHWILLSCTGIFAGLSIVGMHYIGNFGITNYHLTYTARFLTASVILAIGDCGLVLFLFYTWREKWISLWWKRLLCAVFLAGGVSSMHFTASTHCMYVLRGYNGPSAIRSRDVETSVAGALCGAAAATILCVLFFTRHRASVLKTRSQKVMLACAMFDPQGRLLVTTEGVLPAKQITDQYQHRTFNEQFDTAHPVFQWIFRMTRNWPGVSDLIPKMKSHLSAMKKEQPEEDSRPVSSRSSAVYEPDTYSDYSILFRERFCVAAASLASSFHIPTEKMGVLYDRIIETGTLKTDDKANKRNTFTIDAEAGLKLQAFGRGQVMFLTRQLSQEEADKMLNAGFKFGRFQQIGRNIAGTMQVPLSTLDTHIAQLRRYVDDMHSLEKAGTWLSFFAMIPRANTKIFDVAVKKDAQEQLPDTQLLPLEPRLWQQVFLQRMDGLKLRQCVAFLEDRDNIDLQRTTQEEQFAMVLVQAISRLSGGLPVEWVREARFLARPVYAHYLPQNPSRTASPVTVLYSFCVITDVHMPLESYSNLGRVPITFFSMRQRCYRGSPDHGILAQAIHQEFGPLLARRVGGPQTDRQRGKKFSISMPKGGRRFSKSEGVRISTSPRSPSTGDASDGSSVHELMEQSKVRRVGATDLEKGHDATDRDDIWGGILVNSETVVKSDSKSDYSHDSKHLGMGMNTAVGTAKQEDTFVDELMEATKIRFMTPKIGY